ncbi:MULTISPECIES: type III effector [Pseudomonas]|uniref:type III effector n=1 Tax=Pseudomonas TaxID=286 RepID=UPI001BE7623C|nr:MULTISPECIES: type III effector [Pseudomonas]MBT2340245.1 type III effector [Pseudomonas fluorescens]MCD4530253.1 type III effector [Pseudomonas sp. C3-2018]
MPHDSSPIGRTGALHGVDSAPSSSSSSLSQQPLDAQQRRASQSLQERGRSSSAPPTLHQRGRTRTREANRTARAASHAPESRPSGETDASTAPATPASSSSLMSDMESRQRLLMERQFELQMGMEERQADMLRIKSAADMTKLMSDTVTEVTKGFLDSARKVMQEGGEAMKLR